MKTTKAILVSMMTILAVIMLGSVSALDVNINKVKVNDMIMDSVTTAVFAGEELQVKVFFTANQEVTDAKVRARISGYRDDIESVSDRIHLLEGSQYTKTLLLNLPGDIDLSENYTLYVSVEGKGEYVENAYELRIQRESYNAEVLGVSSESNAKAGEDLEITIVLKNRGYEELEDLMVEAKILGTNAVAEAYLYDLPSTDSEEHEDAVEKVLKLRVPVYLNSGEYTVEVKISNSDFTTQATKAVVISGLEDTTRVLMSDKNQKFKAGETGEWSFEIVNLGIGPRVYEIEADTNEEFSVKVPAVVVVGEGESKVITVEAIADKAGIYNFAVEVNSEGKQVEKAIFSAKVEKGFFDGSTVFAIVLAIIFAVLLIVLIVLLTKKPKGPEELEESYY